MSFSSRAAAGSAPSATAPSAPTLNKPYSFSLNPRAIARSRSATLCSLLPVKYWSAAPKRSSGTTRRSTCTPVVVWTLVFVSPLASTFATSSRVRNASISLAGSFADARMSMSPIVSLPRRRLPAYATRSTNGRRPSSATIRSASGIASAMRTRPRELSANAIASVMFAIVFAPMRGSFATAPESIASLSDARSTTPASTHSARAVFGPIPWIPSTSLSPGGTCARSSSSSDIVFFSANSCTFAAVDAPRPSIPFSSTTDIAAASPGNASTARAALRNAFTLKTFAPRISDRTASSSNAAATSALVAMRAAYQPRAGRAGSIESSTSAVRALPPCSSRIASRARAAIAARSVSLAKSRASTAFSSPASH